MAWELIDDTCVKFYSYGWPLLAYGKSSSTVIAENDFFRPTMEISIYWVKSHFHGTLSHWSQLTWPRPCSIPQYKDLSPNSMTITGVDLVVIWTGALIPISTVFVLSGLQGYTKLNHLWIYRCISVLFLHRTFNI